MDYIHALHSRGQKAHAEFGLLLWLGIFNIVLGLLAITFTSLATFAAVIYLGWLFIFSGLVMIFFAYRIRETQGHWSFVFFGVLAAVCGVFLLAHPMENAVILTMLIAVFIFTSGLVSLVSCLFGPHPHKSWVVLSGIISIICAIVIYAEWPVSGTWVPGTFMGVYLIFHGFSQVQIALAGRRLARPGLPV
ncbi:MAG TPA: DUF308 domain-containing protein [bacterium]|jgi:uncharacterized membrane protein HdeD (DUF308 family)|nr:DUF308 domain-containing protein [bacterium]